MAKNFLIYLSPEAIGSLYTYPESLVVSPMILMHDLFMLLSKEYDHPVSLIQELYNKFEDNTFVVVEVPSFSDHDLNITKLALFNNNFAPGASWQMMTITLD